MKLVKVLKNPFKTFLNRGAFRPVSERKGQGIHPIFSKFPLLKIELTPGEKYYEWVDVLEAIDGASQTFVMFEVGAGRAARGKIAARAAQSRKIPVFFHFVEGEPYRALNEIPEEMEKLKVQKESYQVFPYCVGKVEKEVIFYFSSQKQDLSLSNWLGQSKIMKQDYIVEWTEKKHMGMKVGISQSGYEAVMVQQKKFSDLLEETGSRVIDLCDFDIQGAEFEVIKESMLLLKERVKRLHIGTHGLEIEKQLLRLLKQEGWRLIRYYPCHSDVETDFGKAHFIDGVQTWVNPSFMI